MEELDRYDLDLEAFRSMMERRGIKGVFNRLPIRLTKDHFLAVEFEGQIIKTNCEIRFTDSHDALFKHPYCVSNERDLAKYLSQKTEVEQTKLISLAGKTYRVTTRKAYQTDKEGELCVSLISDVEDDRIKPFRGWLCQELDETNIGLGRPVGSKSLRDYTADKSTGFGEVFPSVRIHPLVKAILEGTLLDS